jgi:hypothetical protein
VTDSLAPSSSADANDAKPQRGIQSLDSTGELLGALVAAARPLSLRDLAALAGMPPAKAFPHLVSLLKIGLLDRDASGCFEAGPLALELGLIPDDVRAGLLAQDHLRLAGTVAGSGMRSRYPLRETAPARSRTAPPPRPNSRPRARLTRSASRRFARTASTPR